MKLWNLATVAVVFAFFMPSSAPVLGEEQAASHPDSSAAPSELKVVQDEHGKLQLQFKEQPWLAVLQWLAEQSGMSLHWNSLPEGNLNVVTQRSYDLREARDLINMHLLARGFTLLQRGEFLSVEPLQDLNTALVPRVEAEELGQRDTHEFVRVSFDLDWLVAEQAVGELAPLLSQFGKVMPMSSTNRVEAVDVVANLRQIRRVLEAEQSDTSRSLVQEFKLKHARADRVIDMLRELLGIEGQRRMRTSDKMRLQLEEKKVASEFVKKLGKGAKEYIAKETPVHLVANREENSILANAPADKMALIRQAIQSIDRSPEQKGSVWENINRVKIYRMEGIELDAVRDLVGELQELGNVSPDARLELDDQNDVLIVYATPEDHLAIASLVRQFAKDDRSAEVISLRHLEPDYAAQAVRLMLRFEEEYNYRRRGSPDRFHVEPDVEHQRLLMWGTSEEISQVWRLLAKLGEPGDLAEGTASPGERIRILPTHGADMEEVMQRIRAIWPQARQNRLIMEKETPGRKIRRIHDAGERPIQEPERQRKTSDSKESVAMRERAFRLRLASQWKTASGQQATEEHAGLALASAETASPEQSDSLPPVTVTETPGDEIIVTSEDPQAARELERLLRGMLPEGREFEIFHLEHASALGVQYQLQEYFANRGEYESPWQRYRRGGEPEGLSSRQKLTFVAETETNTLLVQNATSAQLKQIGELIELYDRPPREDEERERQTQYYKVQHGSAEDVVEVLKEVYRDLLSEVDKTFERNGDREEDRESRRYGSSQIWYSTADKKPRFKGQLSLGIDPVANAVVVSAPGFLIEDVLETIRQIDVAAAQRTVNVVKLGHGVSQDTIRQALGGLVDLEPAEPRGERSRRDRDRRSSRSDRDRRDRN